MSHKYADSQEQLEKWNKELGFNLPLWWWDAYVHMFIAYYDPELKKILPTRYPLACTENISKQVDLTTADMVFESDFSVLNQPEKFEKNRAIYHALPSIITANKIKKHDKKLFIKTIEQHKAGEFEYCYEQNQQAHKRGCCQLYARTLIEACGLDYKKIKLPKEISVLGWHNTGQFEF